ncbi:MULTISPECIES: magnesium and cobalt transport protein CorA [Streptomyces]|uniref:Magnesium and cobalt transport protein CorA n=1 Tax=Streptomyces tsukubensis (strain DSM 42081 / NBRC 108919 / NRRL 18488 / 9993) TaxID=1114943 RepID=I2N5Q0_STRT9|nr:MULTISPECIES: magnesium and cobalt transport protein CorA [Streptomyces]AZK96356.1 magnesium transporter CorA [Streptomyces tsukubensis]EIF92347.1 Mg2 transporter protein CorA family protein [Streptomyces tsukubensis NRRL18488]MYS63121.1 magnesium transporter CorA [Streptomyces sp. SID5473]QKM67636.1 magnesium and cobalt transport protein CorA [Streptomyces tsukubensis NRRL18488]TAI44034.1 magnesium and cobalt transport protein CorA [Streptomyces tsukubensis]
MSMIRDLRAAVRPSRRRTGDAAHPATAAYPAGYDTPRDPSASSAVVDCAVYRDGSRLESDSCLTPREAMLRVREGGGFAWIGLHEPTEEEFAGIAAEFGLHPLAVEDAVHAHQRPKLERYDDTLFTVFKTVHYVEHAELTATSDVVETGEVMCFTGRDFVITVRHGGRGSLRALRHGLQKDTELLSKGPSAVLHALADHVVDGYIAVAEAMQDDIDEVEIEVFSAPSKGSSARGTDAGRIYQLKREVLEFKRAVTPLLRPMQLLSERPMRLIDPDIQKYFRDVADHLARVQEEVLGFDELLNSILQANLAQATVAQNEDMRKITSWAAIIAVPTAVCGVYGMNFEYMPELTWKYGYPMVLTAIGVICFTIHRTLKRNGWL